MGFEQIIRQIVREELERTLTQSKAEAQPLRSTHKPRKLTTAEVADNYSSHVVTVRIALNKGVLHGKQRTEGGTWLIEESCAEAWLAGEPCTHLRKWQGSILLRRD